MPCRDCGIQHKNTARRLKFRPVYYTQAGLDLVGGKRACSLSVNQGKDRSLAGRKAANKTSRPRS
jgi:hypothetical protein